MTRNDGDELAARRSARIIEAARLSMVRTSGVEGARRVLERGAARLIKKGYARGVPGLCPAPEEDRPVCRRVVAEGAGLCPKHLAEAERIERRLAATERKEAREAARSAAEARRKATPAKVRSEGTAGRTAQEKAKAGRPGHSEPYRPFTGQCTGLNSKKKPCRLPALEGSDRCEHHPR